MGGSVCHSLRLMDTTADQSAVELRWEAPSRCPDVSDVREDIFRRVRSSVRESPPRFAARVRISFTGGTWRLRLTTQGSEGRGSREIRGEGANNRCDRLAEAAAVMIALALDTEAERAKQAEFSADATRRSADGPAPTPAVQESAPNPWSFSSRAGVGVDLGSLPSASAGVFLGAGARFAALRLEGGAHLWADKTVTRVVAGSIRGADVSQATFDARACVEPHLGPRRWSLAACAGFVGTRTAVRGFGALEPRREATLWASASTGLALRVAIHGRVGVVATSDVLFHLNPPEIGIPGAGEVHPSSTALRTLIGLELAFGDPRVTRDPPKSQCGEKSVTEKGSGRD